MKRLICIVLSLMLMMGTVSAFAADYSLQEKLSRQLEYGSGLKGTILLDVSGTSDWAKTLTVLNGVDLELRSITSGDTSELMIYALDVEENKGTTTFQTNGKQLIIASDLVPESVLSADIASDVISTLRSDGEEVNPAWFSIAVNMLKLPADNWNTNWETALEPYLQQIETWMNSYADAPKVEQNDHGEYLMTVSYEIPAESVKQEMIALIADAVRDESLAQLLRSQMSEMQAAAYVNPQLIPYYTEVLNALEMNGDLKLTRVLTSRGETQELSVELPFPTISEWTKLLIHEQADHRTIQLMGTPGTVTFEQNTPNVQEGRFSWEPSDGKADAVAFDYKLTSSEKSYTDEQVRDHTLIDWTLDVTPVEGVNTAAWQAIRADIQMHYYSKNSPASPTTLLITGKVVSGEDTVAIDAKLKSAAPWYPVDFSGSIRTDLLKMTEEQKTKWTENWTAEAIKLLASLTTTIPMPEEPAEATATDLEAADALATDLQNAEATITDVP